MAAFKWWETELVSSKVFKAFKGEELQMNELKEVIYLAEAVYVPCQYHLKSV